MSQDVFIFEVTENNFSTLVVQNSHKLPVIVEFMAVWSEPCFATSELFSILAREFAGKFIFAKVDIDEQPELRKKFQIQNVPTLKVFSNGEVVRTEEGQLQETEARALLRDYGIFYESDVMREQARDKHLAGDTAGAIMLLTEAIQKHPGNTRIAMDMVQIFIDIGDITNAQGLFAKLPVKDKDSEMGKALNGQLTFINLAAKTDGIETLQQRVSKNSNNHQARFDLAVCQIANHQYEQAMDNLFLILTNAPDFSEGAAREMIITLIRMLTPVNPQIAQDYQRKLNNMLN